MDIQILEILAKTVYISNTYLVPFNCLSVCLFACLLVHRHAAAVEFLNSTHFFLFFRLPSI